MDNRQEITKRRVLRELREFVFPANIEKEDEKTKESEILFLTGLRKKRERVNIIPLKRLTKQALMFVGGNNCSQPHEEERYWSWVDEVKKVAKDILFVFEGQDKEIYTLPADYLWYMGNKSAREDELLGTEKFVSGYRDFSYDVSRDRNFNIV